MKKHNLLSLLTFMVMLCALAPSAKADALASDLGNGMYRNPIIFADFPDPDVVRVGDTYYMATTTMSLFPGCTLLKSKDLVNWEYCAQPLGQLSVKDNYSLRNGQNAYAKGMWACSIAHHNGRFYILINGNDAGGYVLSTTDPEGQWEKKKIDRVYYDPGMLFDNGKVYIVCGSTTIRMCELDEDFNFIKEKTLLTAESMLEGCHLYKIGEYYYIYGTYGGWPSAQTVLRSKDIFGPYEEKMLVEKYIDGKVNTIHQGSLIQTPAGEWWTIMQQDVGAFGRVPNLQPVRWENNWPVVGNNGVPYSSYRKPTTSESVAAKSLPTNDGFRHYQLGMQWEWNHNPNDAGWSLTERPGWLRLKSCSAATHLAQARNMLTQRIFAYHDNSSRESTGTVRIDVSNLQEGDRAGICLFQDPYAAIAVEMVGGKKRLVWWQDQLTVNSGFVPSQQTADIALSDVVYLRAGLTYGTSKSQFYYSTDGKNYKTLGGQTTFGFNLSVFVGTRFGLFCYNTLEGSDGHADFDWFTSESEFDEDTFYGGPFGGYADDMLTVESVAISDDEMELMVGNSQPLNLVATYRDGHSENVAAKAQYVSSSDDIATVQEGALHGVGEGVATIAYQYTDPKGNTRKGSFRVRSTFFPFAKEHISTSLFSQGSYDETTHSFTTGQYGQMGWEYGSGADFSKYKYLVVKLGNTCSGAHLNLFTDSSIWGNCCGTPDFGSKKQIVVDLTSATYTSGGKTGQALDCRDIRIVSFWANSATIVVDDMYLTNNSDYTREQPATIASVTTATPSSEGVWSVDGKRQQSLRKGMNIVRKSDGSTVKVVLP